MRFKYRKVDELPRLSWLLELAKGSSTVQVTHGPWVETTPSFFCAGVWDGDFGEGAFDTSFLSGTGGKVLGDRLLVATPSHTLDRIFYLRDRDRLLISNSVAFVLAHTGDDASPSSLLYHSRLQSISKGINGYSRWLPTQNGKRVYMAAYCNLEIENDLRVHERRKPDSPAISSYSDYKHFLDRTVAEIGRNATDVRRYITYRPVASISSGYDSSAAAVLARSIGCELALTFKESRHRDREGNIQSDSGRRVAEHLGMAVKEFDRVACRNLGGFPEIENYGSPENMLAWAEDLPASILFTGFHGGGVWSRRRDLVSNNFVRHDSGGSMSTEFALRVGFIQIAPAYMNGPNVEPIHRISISEEMKPWSMGGSYDRPIARRIVEEAGVPRSWFGQSKKAVALTPRAEGLANSMTPQSFADFQQFCDARWNLRLKIKGVCLNSGRLLGAKSTAISGRIERTVKRRFGREIKLPRIFPARAYPEDGQTALLFHWAMHRLITRYRVQAEAAIHPLEARARKWSVNFLTVVEITLANEGIPYVLP